MDETAGKSLKDIIATKASKKMRQYYLIPSFCGWANPRNYLSSWTVAIKKAKLKTTSRFSWTAPMAIAFVTGIYR